MYSSKIYIIKRAIYNNYSEFSGSSTNMAISLFMYNKQLWAFLNYILASSLGLVPLFMFFRAISKLSIPLYILEG